MEERQSCDGRCERCNVNQRMYCASQMAYYNQKEIAEIKAILERNYNGGGQSIILNEKVATIEEE